MARKILRPMRPNPLIATFTVMLETFDERRGKSPVALSNAYELDFPQI
jgi:hypothetical protein